MITVMGEALIDIIVDPRGEVTSVVGGAPLNTARTIARLGEAASFLGGVSTDAFGQRILRMLTSDGVSLAMGQCVPEPSTLAIAQIDESGAATYRFMLEGTSAAAVTPAKALECMGSDVSMIHVGTLGLVLEPLASASAAVVAAARDDQIVMVDPNCRPSVMTSSEIFDTTLASVLTRADVVKVSGDDLAFMFPGERPMTAAEHIHMRSGVTVLFTDGAEAVRVICAGGVESLSVPAVPVVDTVGAGDSFSGGFLVHWKRSGWLREDLKDLAKVAEATRFGISVAGITCQRAGAEPPFANEVPAH